MVERWNRAIQLIELLQEKRIILSEVMMIVNPMARYQKVASKLVYGKMDLTDEDLDIIEDVIKTYSSL